MAGIPLLAADQLALIKDALANVFATFAKEDVVFLKRIIGFDNTNFGEQVAVPPPQEFPIQAIYAYTAAHDGKYDTIQRTELGNELHDGFRLFIWKDDMVTAGLTVDPEVDQVVFKGKTYKIDFAAPSAQFSDLGDLLFEVEIRFKHRGT